MPKFTCVFVDQDKETIFEDAITLQLEFDSSKSAAQEYLNQYGRIGPYVKVCDETGYGDDLFPVKDFVENPEEREATKKKHAEAKKKQAEAKQAAEIKQVEAKQAAQTSLSSTDVLLKELIKEQKQMIKEQKQANESLRKIWWLLIVIAVTLTLWRALGVRVIPSWPSTNE